MSDQKTKTVSFNDKDLAKLPDGKPVVYKILDNNGENIYTGTAKRGRVRERLAEHLPDGPNPIPGGRKVRIERVNTVDEARAKEARIIARSQPKFNEQTRG